MRRNAVVSAVIMGMCTLALTGCQEGAVQNQVEQAPVSETDEAAGGGDLTQGDIAATEISAEAAASSGENQDQGEKDAGQANQGQEKEPEEKAEQEESEGKSDNSMKEAPRLPESGRRLADFVPEGWQVCDSVELDFNEDGIPDYVGVLQAVATNEEGYQVYPLGYPRILFGIASEGTEAYRLDFQDVNVIRTRDEGGVFGDPYQPLTAEGTSFTTHTYGGSAWRWSEDYTYTYREGTWWLTASEKTYGYGDYITDYGKNDWVSGVGIRKKRSSDWGPMEENFALITDGDWDAVGYDLEYEVPLDGKMTLEQAGKRWWLAKERVTDWEVKETVFAADVALSQDSVKMPGEAYIEYCDEERALYTFNVDSDTGERSHYLAMYSWRDKVLSVLAREDSPMQYPQFYDGKIYFASEIVENVTYRKTADGKEQITQEEETVGVRLNRMEPEGTGKEVIFEYRYPETPQDIMESRIPYLSLNYEIGGGEIVVEVYLGGEPHPFYRMKTDGSGQERIGQVPK